MIFHNPPPPKSYIEMFTNNPPPHSHQVAYQQLVI